LARLCGVRRRRAAARRGMLHIGYFLQSSCQWDCFRLPINAAWHKAGTLEEKHKKGTGCMVCQPVPFFLRIKR